MYELYISLIMILGLRSSACVSIKTKMQLYAKSTYTIKYNNTTPDFILHVTFFHFGNLLDSCACNRILYLLCKGTNSLI